MQNFLPVRSAVLIVVSTLVVSCGGGGGRSTPRVDAPDPDPPSSLSAISLAPVGRPLTAAERRHFVVRTGFTYDQDRDADLEGSGLRNAIEQLIVFRPEPELDATVNRILREPTRAAVDDAWLHYLAHGRQPFREALALFWHQQLAVSQMDLSDSVRHLYPTHVRLLRSMTIGNLREFCYRILVDGATQIDLDGITTDPLQPNENLAREFWELLTLGPQDDYGMPNYSERDIEESARALTGFVREYDSNLDRVVVRFDPEQHDNSPKTIFGRTGVFGPREVVNLTFELRPVVESVCRRLFEWLAYPDPPIELVDELAVILRANNYEMRPLLRELLQSEAFLSQQSRDCRCVKSPVRYFVGFLRATGLELPPSSLTYRMTQLQQLPSRPPSIAGWPSDRAWLSDRSLLERRNAIVAAISNRSYQYQQRIGLARILDAIEDESAPAVVDSLAKLLDVQLTATDRKDLIGYMNSEAVLTVSGELAIERSEFHWIRHREERVRGLLQILTQHPDYHVR